MSVTYLASEIDNNMGHGTESIAPCPYYLYVASRDAAYKNFNSLLTAFAKVASINTDINLCVVGSPFKRAEEKLISELNLSDRIEHYGQVDDHHLAKLYSCRIALIYPFINNNKYE